MIPMRPDAADAGGALRLTGLVGWGVIFALMLAWEGLGLVFGRERWPTISDMVRTVSRPLAGRSILFAFWLWLGWHFFYRGWKLFLRA